MTRVPALAERTEAQRRAQVRDEEQPPPGADLRMMGMARHRGGWHPGAIRER